MYKKELKMYARPRFVGEIYRLWCQMVNNHKGLPKSEIIKKIAEVMKEKQVSEEEIRAALDGRIDE